MLFFKNQNLSPKEYINFSSNFGTPAKYPMLKPHKDFKDIYVIERKKPIKEKVLVKVHTRTLHICKILLGSLFYKLLMSPKKEKGNTLFYNQFLAYEALPKNIKDKIENLKGIFSSQGKIAQTRELRMADHGTSGTKEIKSEHKLVQSIDGRKTIYCSPGHVVGIVNLSYEQNDLISLLSSHQIKKNFRIVLDGKRVILLYGQIDLCFMLRLRLTVTGKCIE